MKKLLALALALMLGLCSISSALAGAEEDEMISKLHPYDETVTVTIMGTDEKDTAVVFDSSNPDRASATENAWISAYKKYLNIDVKRIVAEDGGALTANLNTMMASGDLPDVMIVPKAMFAVLAENGVLRDVSQEFDSYDGELWMELKNSYDESHWAAGMYEGEMLGIPYKENLYNCLSVLWIRQDWLDALGLKAPTTIDEMLDVARAFVSNKMGGENTIGLGINNGTDTGWDQLVAPYGAVLQTWQESDGGYKYADTITGLVEPALLKLQEIYKEGIIKSDFVVTDILEEEIANGVVGMYYAPGWHAVTTAHAAMMNDPKCKWTAVQIPTLDGKPVKQHVWSNVSNFVVFNSDFDHADAFFRMKELENYVYYYANKEVSGELRMCPDNYTIWNLMVFRGMQRGDLDFYKTRLIDECVKNGTTVDDAPAMVKADLALCYQALEGDRDWEKYTILWHSGGSYVVAGDLVEQGFVQGPYNGPLTETMSLYQDTIDAELRSAMIKVIMGEDVSVYEKAVDSWYKNGGEKITEEVNEYYNSLS